MTARPPASPVPPPPRPPVAPGGGGWRRTPPAIFPAILGLWGLGLGWRAAGEAAGFGPAPGEVILGAVFLLWLGALVAYGAKVARRPGVLAEEVRVLPGQSGLAALGMATMAGAGGVLPHAPGIGAAMLVAGFVAHVALAVGMARRLLAAPPEGRAFSPVWHMIFVGPILAVAPAAALGFGLAAAAILAVTLANAVVLWLAGGRALARARPPGPLRPTLAIHLAPASLAVIGALSVGAGWLVPVAAVWTLGLLVALLASARWLTAAGFSPMWGAFTFPLAAAARALIEAGGAFAVAGALALALATLIVPWIALRILRMWADGTLAERTNAATA